MKNTTLIARRLFENLSQSEFAAEIGYSQATIGLVESGQREPSRQLRGAIARRFPYTDEFLSFLYDYEKMNGIIHDYTLSD